MAKKQLTDAMKVVVASMVALLKEGKSDAEVIEASKTDKIGDEDCTDELLTALLGLAKNQIEAENAAAAAAEKKAKEEAEKAAAAAEKEDFHGNQDKEKKYPKFPAGWRNQVIVRESQSSKIGPKDQDVVEIPSSVKFKPFDASLYDTHVKQGMFNKKNVEIVHDPR